MFRTLGKIMVINCLLALTGSVVAYDLNPNNLKWHLPKTAKLITRNGHKILSVQVAPGSKEVSGRNLVTAQVDLVPFHNEVFICSASVRYKNIEPTGKDFQGVSLSLYYKDESTGREGYPGSGRSLGTSDWKTLQLSSEIPAGATTGIIRFMVEHASGEAELDLSTLQIHTPERYLKTTEPSPPGSERNRVAKNPG